MIVKWEDGFDIRTSINGDEITISANREGMVSLANIFLTLAEENPGVHIHLDESNSLEDGSCGLIVERID